MQRKKELTRLAYGVPEVAAMIGTSPGFVRLEIARKRLAALRRGRRLLIAREEIDRYISPAS